MQRSAQHPARLLACAAAAALPVTLTAACSPGTASDSTTRAGASSSPSAAASASPSFAPGRFARLPDACSAISQKTVKALIPKAENDKGEATDPSPSDTRGGCSWNGLNGYQYRWLDVSFQRFDSVRGLGPAQDRAAERYRQQIGEALAARGAASSAVPGVGDQATAVSAEVTRDKDQYQEITVIARTANAVVVVSYDGAGFENAKTPAAGDLRKDAVSAAKEAVAAIAAANT
jgi:hypothetical protein